jgi:glycerol kinase
LINFSAGTMEWLKTQLGLIGSASEVERLARSVQDNGGVYLVPAFAGLSAPYWSPHARAAILGMTAFTQRAHVVRAAEEAIAYQIRDVLDAMRRDAKVTLRSLHADGGPTGDRFLMQFVADLCGLELRVANVPESSAWGAASAGLLGLGLQPSLEDLGALPRNWTIYRPRMSRQQAGRLHEGWTAAVRRVL